MTSTVVILNYTIRALLLFRHIECFFGLDIYSSLFTVNGSNDTTNNEKTTKEFNRNTVHSEQLSL